MCLAQTGKPCNFEGARLSDARRARGRLPDCPGRSTSRLDKNSPNTNSFGEKGVAVQEDSSRWSSAD